MVRYEGVIKDNEENIGDRGSETKDSTRNSTKIFNNISERKKSRKSITSNCNFILSSKDKSIKESFNFYKNDGFLNFINLFEKFLDEEKINIKEELYEEKINEQILEIIMKNVEICRLFNIKIFLPEKNNLNNYLKNANALNKKDNRKNNPMLSIKYNDIYYGRHFVIQKQDTDEIYIYDPIKTNLNSSINSVLNKSESIELDKYLYNENIISFFPNFTEYNEEDKVNSTINNENINLKCNFYLFVTLILENLFEDKRKSEDFINKIKMKKKINNLEIKSLIIKVYSIAYKYSGKKHYDFPYYSYYSFLYNLSIKDLQLLKKVFDDIKEKELFEIYNKILNGQEVFSKTDKGKNYINDKSKINKILNKENEKQNDIINKEKHSPEEKNIFSLSGQNSEKSLPYIISSEFNPFKTYTIDIKTEFVSNILNLKPNEIIINFARELLSIFLYKKDYNNNNIDIITELNIQLSENKKIFELINQLKYINLETIINCRERICFWVNCFNFLIIFTIIYKKWNLNKKEDWKYFFRKVKFLIGEKYFALIDMLYLLNKKSLLFQSNYKKNHNIKKMRVKKAYDAKNIEKVMPLIYSPFMIYLPTKGFKKPVILEEKTLDSQINEIVRDYLNEFIIIDKFKDIIIPELLYDYQPRFLWKDYKKYQSFLKGPIYSFIKEKQYKGYNISPIDWKLNFDTLFNQ